MLSLAGKGPRVILTDSLSKYVKVPRAVVKTFPGETVTKLTDSLPWRDGHQADGQNQVWPGGYLPAWENTGSRRYQWCGWRVEVQESKVSDTAAGPEEIQGVERGHWRRNSRALILFSSILPRLKQFRKFKPYVLGLNFALEKWCTESWGSYVFIPSYRSFLAGGQPREELFAKDGLRFNRAGVDRLKACLQQALLTEHLMVRVTAELTRKLSELTYWVLTVVADLLVWPLCGGVRSSSFGGYRWEGTKVPWYLSHPSLGWLLCFQFVYATSATASRPPPQQLLPLTSKLFELNLRYLAQRIWVWGNVLDDLSMTLT